MLCYFQGDKVFSMDFTGLRPGDKVIFPILGEMVLGRRIDCYRFEVGQEVDGKFACLFFTPNLADVRRLQKNYK